PRGSPWPLCGTWRCLPRSRTRPGAPRAARRSLSASKLEYTPGAEPRDQKLFPLEGAEPLLDRRLLLLGDVLRLLVVVEQHGVDLDRLRRVLVGLRLLRVVPEPLRLRLPLLVLHQAAQQVARLLGQDPLRRPLRRLGEHLGEVEAGTVRRPLEVDPEARPDVLLQVGVRLDHAR